MRREVKTETDVNSHDVVSFALGTNVGRSQRLHKIIQLSLVNNSRNRKPSRQNVPNPLIAKIQHGGGRHTEFQKKLSISGLHKDISIKFCAQMHHGYVKMIP